MYSARAGLLFATLAFTLLSGASDAGRVMPQDAYIWQRKWTPAVQAAVTQSGFRLPLGLKDIDLVLQTAREANVPMPTASLLRDRFVSAIAKGRSDLDWSAIALGAADDADLKQ